MISFDVDKNNDLFIGEHGNLSICRDEKATMRVCEHYVRAKRGEMLHKFDKGMPFWSSVFGANADLALFESVFRERMREISEVIEIVSFSAQLIDNTVKYLAVIRTQYGVVEVNNGRV
ncbi:MAG: hypothetical protein LBN41_04210 [Enterobacteriaceae bacterium]|jgi:hypothetical protein|nr:hypothetical protein [Enterobacteriaceae bacterium]